jgi:hypothetical protein
MDDYTHSRRRGRILERHIGEFVCLKPIPGELRQYVGLLVDVRGTWAIVRLDCAITDPQHVPVEDIVLLVEEVAAAQ